MARLSVMDTIVVFISMIILDEQRTDSGKYPIQLDFSGSGYLLSQSMTLLGERNFDQPIQTGQIRDDADVRIGEGGLSQFLDGLALAIFDF
jgi:hypothetical protein